MPTTNDERETHINLSAADRTKWEIACDDPVMIARIEKAGHKPVRVKGEVKFYEVPYAAVLLRKGKREVSEATRQAMAERLKNLRTTGGSEGQTA